MTCPATIDHCILRGADYSYTVALEGVALDVGPIEWAIDNARGETVHDATIASGEIAITSQSPDGTFVITLTAATTATLPTGRHVHALWVTDAAGLRHVYLQGRVLVSQPPEAG